MLDLIRQGGPVMLAILACSFVSLAFIIERLLFWFVEMGGEDRRGIDAMMSSLRQGRLKVFTGLCAASRDPVAKVFSRSLEGAERTLGETLALEVEESIEKTTRSLNLIDTVVTLAPLLGIFGTVTGIIQSFDIMGGQGIADPKAASAGIAQALITTAAGLAVAMPSLIFHNYFANKSERFAFRLEKYAREFEILYNAVNSPAINERHCEEAPSGADEATPRKKCTTRTD